MNSNKRREPDEATPLLDSTAREPYPKAIFFVIGNEFCERFSYYGLKAVLVLYLINELLYEERTATVIFHAFTMLCYFTPLFGASLADFLFGKFKTIVALSCIYAVGDILLSVASIPPNLLSTRVISVLGLVVIAIGTGGIKPCVSSFGGDQFGTQQESRQRRFFSLYYLAVNFGSLVSMFLTPILRADVSCFGRSTCFPLAFGLPAILMIVSTVIFVAGRSTYKTPVSSGGEAIRVLRCLAYATSKRCKSEKDKNCEHWLDYAGDSYDAKTISDAKVCLRLLPLFLPLPVFWALFDQQGSTWTLQATNLNPSVLGYELKPDQLQAVNPLLMVIFIPLFEFVVYPLLNKCHLLTRPLQRMTVGGLLTALSFILAGFLQLSIENNISFIPNSYSHPQIINGLPCDLQVDIPSLSSSSILTPNQLITEENIKIGSNLSLHLTPVNCVSWIWPQTYFLETNTPLETLFVYESNQTLCIQRIEEDTENPKMGKARVRIFSSLENTIFHFINPQSESKTLFSLPAGTYFDLESGEYTIYTFYKGNVESSVFVFESGGSYDLTVIIDNNGKLVWRSQRNILSSYPSILLQIPQYFLITAGEIMYSITGLTFSYSQAPKSLKSLLQASWLMTTAFGNLIVLIIAEIRIFEKQSYEFFLFAILMILDVVVFAILARFYKYVKPDQVDTKQLVTQK